MPGKKKLRVPDNQLTLIPIEPELPKKEKKPKVKRIASLEERVTRLEGEVALLGAAMIPLNHPACHFPEDMTIAECLKKLAKMVDGGDKKHPPEKMVVSVPEQE